MGEWCEMGKVKGIEDFKVIKRECKEHLQTCQRDLLSVGLGGRDVREGGEGKGGHGGIAE